MSFSARQLQGLARTFQRNAESACPGTLNFGTQDILCSRGPWRSLVKYNREMGTQVEMRTVTVRVRKALLNDAVVVLTPGQSTGTLDGVLVTLDTGPDAGPNEDAFRLTLVAPMPDDPQD